MGEMNGLIFSGTSKPHPLLMLYNSTVLQLLYLPDPQFPVITWTSEILPQPSSKLPQVAETNQENRGRIAICRVRTLATCNYAALERSVARGYSV